MVLIQRPEWGGGEVWFDDKLIRKNGLFMTKELKGLNPKNLALTIAAATAIAETGISSGQEAGALAVFVVLGSVGILTPVAVYFLLGERAKGILEGLKAWMAAHNAAIMTVLLLVLGAKLIGDAITGLSS